MEAKVHEVAADTGSRRRPLTPGEIGQLVAFFAVLLGAFLFLYPAYLAGFPINDGGMFYTMLRALQANSFRLPPYVQYNGLAIPFAYPPLGFYVGAALSTLLRLDPLVILQWFPGLVLIPVSIAVYLLARRILGSSLQAGMATFLYVCTPRSLTWLIMGGGLTRSLGQLLMVLTLASVHSLYRDRRRKDLILAVIFASLVVLTHPEAALHTAALCVLFWIFKGRSRRSLMDSLIVIFGALLVTSLWWLPALRQYGFGPFVSAGRTGGLSPAGAFAYIALMAFTEEPLTTIIAALGLIGLATCLARRDFLLPIWLLLPYLVEPRNAGTVAIVPVVLMAAIGLHEMVFPGIASLGVGSSGPLRAAYLEGKAVRWSAVVLAFLLLELAFFSDRQFATVRVSAANRVAFQWIAAHTPPASHFLVMTGDIELFCDPVQEWFPALTQRVSETTIQGYEWGPSADFNSKIVGLPLTQACLQADSPRDCLSQRSADIGLRYDYVYIAQAATAKRYCRPLGDERRGTALAMQLTSDDRYSNVYDSPDVKIFAVTH